MCLSLSVPDHSRPTHIYNAERFLRIPPQRVRIWFTEVPVWYLLFLSPSDNVQHDLQQQWSLITFPKEENLGNKRKTHAPSLYTSVLCQLSVCLLHFLLSLLLPSHYVPSSIPTPSVWVCSPPPFFVVRSIVDRCSYYWTQSRHGLYRTWSIFLMIRIIHVIYPEIRVIYFNEPDTYVMFQNLHRLQRCDYYYYNINNTGDHT